MPGSPYGQTLNSVILHHLQPLQKVGAMVRCGLHTERQNKEVRLAPSKAVYALRRGDDIVVH